MCGNEKIYITAEEINNVYCERESQETAINWLRDDETLIVCSSDNTFITRMKRAMQKDPDNYKCYYYETNRDKKTDKLSNYFFEVPKKLISFRSERTSKEYTKEEKQAIGERLHKKNT